MRKNTLFLAIILSGCMAPYSMEPHHPVMPSVEYSKWVKAKQVEEQAAKSAEFRSVQQRGYQQVFAPPQARGKLRMVKQMPPEYNNQDIITNAVPESGYGSDYIEIPPDPRSQPIIRDYSGPLELGDPGVSASLWKEGKSDNNLFRDYRAWKPMDLITVVIQENTQGIKEADTEVRKQNQLDLGITNLLGYAAEAEGKNPNLETSTAIIADTQQNFIGEGSTERRSQLTGNISAMIVEVLPSGVLRFEGEKIVTMNGEEQVMIISGLVRTRDINAINQVQSSQVANMRIDFYGRGSVNDASRQGWGNHILNRIWPF